MVDINNNYSVFTINSNNVYYGNNSTVTGGCKSGYTQVGGDIKYTCNNGSWSKGSGRCEKVCTGAPSLISGSKFYFNDNNIVVYDGSFYNKSDGKEITTVLYNNLDTITKSTLNNSYAKNGSIVDANCADGYTEVWLADYSNALGKRASNGHYYYCDNGTWKTISRCIRSGTRTFYYTGGSQSFIPPINSNEQITLTLEVWGGGSGKEGWSKGGYSYGKYTAQSNVNLLVYVGGASQGKNIGTTFNGGGSSASAVAGYREGTGGGGTDIRISSRNNIYTCNPSTDPRIIVAGGAGYSSSGGSGGSCSTNAESGNRGTCETSFRYAGGGTTTNGGVSSFCGNSCGGDGHDGTCGIGGGGCGNGGGGGWYGGGAGMAGVSGGGGGSGYCNPSFISDYGGSTGVNVGNGKAVISW